MDVSGAVSMSLAGPIEPAVLSNGAGKSTSGLLDVFARCSLWENFTCCQARKPRATLACIFCPSLQLYALSTIVIYLGTLDSAALGLISCL